MNQPAEDQEPQLREVYCRVVEEPELEQRERLIDQLCEGRPDLRRRVVSLLEARDVASDGLLARAVGAWRTGETSAALSPGSSSTQPDGVKLSIHSKLAGQFVGPYQLVEILGEGGMGTVYRAQQLEPLVREVAVKVIKPELNTADSVARFAQERRSMALMEHPNIANVLEGGESADGSQYLVMELIRGVPLDEYCRTNKLPVDQRLKLFTDLGRAIQHAHSKNIIHRDLKPSNILVATVDDQPIVKVIDFGIAKSFGRPVGGEIEKTRTGHILGTPLYQSPEQLDANQGIVDVRSDVYSLGVVLYKLLTDTTPVGRDVIVKAGYDGLMRRLWEQDYEPPSLRAVNLTSSAKRDALSCATARLSKRQQRELDWITLRTLQPDADDRYPSVAELLEDLNRFLSRQPVLAGAPKRVSRIGKWMRKRQVALSVSVALIATLIGGSYVSRLITDSDDDNSRTEQPLKTASAASWRETAQLQLALSAFRGADYVNLREILAGLDTPPGDLARADLLAGNSGAQPRFTLKQMLHNAAHPKPLLELVDSVDIQSADYSPRRKRLVVATEKGEIRIYSLVNGSFSGPTTIGSHPGRVDAIAISPDGSHAVSGTDSLWFWNLDEAKLEFKGVWLDAGVESIVWSADGQTVAAGARYEATWVGDRSGRELFRVKNDHRHETILFSGDSKLLFIPTRDGIDEYDVASGERLRTIDVLPLLNIRTMSLAGQNQNYLVVADRFEESASVIDVQSGKTVGALPLAGRYPQCFRVTADGKWLAALYPDGKCSLVLLRESQPGNVGIRRKLTFQTFEPQSLSDERRLELLWIEQPNMFLTLGGQHTSQLWDWNGFDPVQVKSPPMQLWDVLPGAEDELVFFPNDSRKIGHRAYFVAMAGKSKQPLGDRLSEPSGVFSKLSHNQLVASLGETNIEVIDLRSGKILAQLDCRGLLSIDKISLSEDGSTLAVASKKEVRVWNTDDRWTSWTQSKSMDVESDSLLCATNDGRTLLVDAGQTVQEVDLLTGAIVKKFDDSRPTAPMEIAIDDDRGRVIVGKRDSLTVFERSTGRVLHQFHVDSEVTSLLCASDAFTLFSGHRNGTIRVWHLDTQQPLGILFQPTQRIGQISRLEFFPDRNRILATARIRNELSPIIIGN